MTLLALPMIRDAGLVLHERFPNRGAYMEQDKDTIALGWSIAYRTQQGDG